MPHASPPPHPADPVQLPLPLKWVPSPARERLRNAHPFPLVGIRDDKGFRSFRTHPRPAWSGRYEYLQAGDAGSCYVAVVLDCDDGHRLRELIEDRRIPGPNWIVWREGEPGELRCHAVWTLEAPVHKGPNASRKPLEMLARAAEWLRHRTRADCSYSGLLTRCPFYERGDLRTQWLAKAPWPLLELLDWIPKGWRRPRVSTTSYGRNCSLFNGLRKWAYQPRNWKAGFEGIHATARLMNGQFDAPLPLREVRDVAKSVAGYVGRKLAQKTWTQQTFSFLQAARGRKSGKTRRKKTAARNARILARRTETGATSRALAKEFGLHHVTIARILKRTGAS